MRPIRRFSTWVLSFKRNQRFTGDTDLQPCDWGIVERPNVYCKTSHPEVLTPLIRIPIENDKIKVMDKDEKLQKEMDADYPLIPLMGITDEARLLAVAWVEGYEKQGLDIPGKQKLASDIMNYARRHAKEIVESENSKQ